MINSEKNRHLCRTSVLYKSEENRDNAVEIQSGKLPTDTLSNTMGGLLNIVCSWTT